MNAKKPAISTGVKTVWRQTLDRVFAPPDTTINFRATPHEIAMANLIVERWNVEMKKRDKPMLAADHMQMLIIDITACHLNGCALDLSGLLHTSHFDDFAHDVIGIGASIDRRTGRLRFGFAPKFRVKLN